MAVVATPGDRRDEDMRDLGRVAARYFDDVIIREDRNTRGRARGETARFVREGVEDAVARGARVGSIEIVLDEMEATRRALDRARPGDVVVLCADYATEVWKELERRKSLAQPSVQILADGEGRLDGAGGDPDLIAFESKA
jgi:cyanophycin synthetase